MKTALLFGIHCHQPIDNFDWVIYDAIEKSYKPFFETLKEFPEFKISVHFSGSLLEFIQNNDNELFSLMKSLSSQIEFFSGGFYEPVLASIPSKDRIGQIKKLNSFIKEHFNQTPKGLWLTERVWENTVIKDIKQCGIEYVIVDDYHISTSNPSEKELNGYFLTEESGEIISLFPIDQGLRYAIPFYTLEQTSEILKSFKNIKGKNAAIIFDDGEKFGIWPKTYETVYEKQWLKDFIARTLEDKDIIVQTFNEYYKHNDPIGLSYLPSVSYFEMGEWTLNGKDAYTLEEFSKKNLLDKRFLRGGIWKNFFTKYQESNWIHKRVLELSKKQFDSVEYKEALYKAQCNDVLWHGVFGGIYLPNLRDTAYKYIIECEKLLGVKKQILDIDINGVDEYKYATDDILAIVSSHLAGQIFELDLLDKNYNLQNTLSRYEESYHKKIEVESPDEILNDDDIPGEIATIHDNILKVDQEISLDYDWYLKKSAIDHITAKEISIEDLERNSFPEYGDFANQPYEVTKSTKKKLNLKRNGGIYKDNKKLDTCVVKKYFFKNNYIDINETVLSASSEKFTFMHEWNFHFADLDKLFFNGVRLEKGKQYSNLEIIAKELRIYDRYLDKTFLFSFDRKIKVFVAALNSISQSEQGVDITNQGVTLGFLYPFEKRLQFDIRFKIV
jgi:hypothetical protein